MALVRSDGDLGGGDAEIDISTVHVIGAEGLQIPRQTLLGVFVTAREKREGTARLQLKTVQQLLFAEGAISDDVDTVYLRNLSLTDVDMDGDPVALQWLHL